ncbi:[acyl-carrier-protein] S-malonyltransferase [Crossiella equi]|uniref:[acyl-carrier-protein] S-malonyltransferase n=1 Tax=Crossiella equi TaxID=130796 RepID=A0ABS5AC51_9PSEU|nr:ACP S-malonyltransferase [Crossiella equi]MBP2473916.1 [acyl-carrier-protein] S-malonyltransferase [Crossiella equi]
MIALLAPGQGSQSPGMFAPWLELPGTAERLAHWSELTKLDLVRLGTTASADEIKDTSVTQPLVVALALLAYEELARRVELPTDVPVAGHSVGELAAAAVGGVLTADDAVALAAVRGAEMAAACALEPTGMTAVMGGVETEVLARIEEFGLIPANRNGAGQIVAAGSLAGLDKLLANPPEKARVKALPVAGAFHTRYMAPAAEALRARAAAVTVNNVTRPLLSNAEGAVLSVGTDGAEVLGRLITQVTSPVRWDACMSTLGATGVTAVVELPPAGTLSGLVKRELPDVARLPLKSPADLDKAVDLFAGGAA